MLIWYVSLPAEFVGECSSVEVHRGDRGVDPGVGLETEPAVGRWIDPGVRPGTKPEVGVDGEPDPRRGLRRRLSRVDHSGSVLRGRGLFGDRRRALNGAGMHRWRPQLYATSVLWLAAMAKSVAQM